MKQTSIYNLIVDNKDDLFNGDLASEKEGQEKRAKVSVGDLVESHNSQLLDKYLDETLNFVSDKI